MSGVKNNLVLKTLVIRRISLNKFNEGGAAIFAADKTNHHIASAGNINIRPFERKSLREFVVV